MSLNISNNLYIGCTSKLLNALHIKKPEQIDKTNFSDIRLWHANFNYLERRKTILFTHDLSNYSFLLIGVRKFELDNIKNIFLDSAANHLFKDGFTEKEVTYLLPMQIEINLGKSHDRSVIGIMNNFVSYLPFLYSRYGMIYDGIPTLNQFNISKELNDTPVHCDKKGFFPLKRLKEIVKAGME